MLRIGQKVIVDFDVSPQHFPLVIQSLNKNIPIAIAQIAPGNDRFTPTGGYYRRRLMR